MVAVRYTGVSRQPHSRTCSDPVISPAPLSTATPAGAGSAGGTIAVTPVRATPRPAGGGRLIADPRHVPDADAGDVGDGVPPPGREAADHQPVLARRRHGRRQ